MTDSHVPVSGRSGEASAYADARDSERAALRALAIRPYYVGDAVASN
jgi:hypothetical protein